MASTKCVPQTMRFLTHTIVFTAEEVS